MVIHCFLLFLMNKFGKKMYKSCYNLMKTETIILRKSNIKIIHIISKKLCFLKYKNKLT